MTMIVTLGDYMKNPGARIYIAAGNYLSSPQISWGLEYSMIRVLKSLIIRENSYKINSWKISRFIAQTKEVFMNSSKFLVCTILIKLLLTSQCNRTISSNLGEVSLL